MTMKKYVVGGAVLILLLIVALSVKSILEPSVLQDSSKSIQTNTLATTGTSGEIQNAKLALVDFSYTLSPKQLKVGVPARIEVDASSLSGCMRNVVIKDFGVRKTISATDNIIEFTPTKTGTFWITCSMGMGPGSFEVVNSDGASVPTTASASTAPPTSTGGSCGMNGGGCGCGG